MATITTVTEGGGSPLAIGSQPIYTQRVVDFSKLQNGKGLNAADILQLWNVDAGVIITKVWSKILTPEGGTLTFDIGVTGDDPNGFNDAVNGNASANTVEFSVAGTDAYIVNNGGRHFDTDDTIDIVLDDAAATAKILFTLEGLNFLAV